MLAQGQSSSAKRGGLAADVSSGLIFLKKKNKQKKNWREDGSPGGRNSRSRGLRGGRNPVWLGWGRPGWAGMQELEEAQQGSVASTATSWHWAMLGSSGNSRVLRKFQNAF